MTLKPANKKFTVETLVARGSTSREVSPNFSYNGKFE